MQTILIRAGRVIDPPSGRDEIADVAIRNGRVVEVGRKLAQSDVDRVIDASGLIVTPGLIDPHVHLREPGAEEAETIASGTAAAVAGGFTTVCCMPNTRPALDTPEMIGFISRAAETCGACRVFSVGAATVGRQGERLAEIDLMARAGAVGFSDDGDAVASAGVMRRVLQAVKQTGRAFMQHCQEPTLTVGASMHAGEVAARLGLGGWPREAEETIIERDILLNRSVGCDYHVQHLSCAESVELIRRARAEGRPVTAEASPHHLLLTHEAVERGPDGQESGEPAYWTNAKMNPPLRQAADVRAVVQGVADGTITVLATDHAPHTDERKGLPFEAAPFGIVGLETALALYIHALVEPGHIDWPRLIALMTTEPAKLCGLDGMGLGSLRKDGPADVTLIDPDLEWTIDASAFRGKTRNTPFDGWRVRGRAVGVVVGGRLALDAVGAGVAS